MIELSYMIMGCPSVTFAFGIYWLHSVWAGCFFFLKFKLFSRSPRGAFANLLSKQQFAKSFRMSCLSSNLSSFTTKAYTLSIYKVFRINLRSFYTSQGLVLEYFFFFLSWGGFLSWNLQNSSLGETSPGLRCLSLWSPRQNRSLNSNRIIKRMHVLQNNAVKPLENMECEFHFSPPFLCVQEWEIRRTFLCPDA